MAENVQGSGVGSWSKWQIALVIGAPLAIGATAVAVYCYSRGGIDPIDKDNADTEGKSSIETGDVEKLSVSAGGDGNYAVHQTEQTPLEKAQASKNRGNKYFKAAHYDQAIRCYTEAIEICPADKKLDMATFYQNRAAAHEQQGKYSEVIADTGKAIEMNPMYTKAMYRRAKAHDHIGNKLMCLEDTTAVCILEGFNHQQGMMLADRMLKEIGKEKAKERYKNRVPQLPSGQFIHSYFSSFSNDGISQVIENLGQQSDQQLSGYLKAKSLFDSGSYDDVIEYCIQEIESEGPHQYEALLMRATFYLLMGQAEWALPDLDQLISNEEASKKLRANALIKRGSMHMQEGNSLPAMDDFATAAHLDPDNPDIYHHRGQLNLLLEKVDDAVKDFEKCNDLNDDFGLAYAQHSYAKYRLAMFQQSPLQMQNAMQMLQTCTTRFPQCAEGFALLAQAQNEQGLYQQADENFKKAVTLEPDNPTAHVHRGLLHLNWKKDVPGAIKMIEEALKIDDKCDFAYETLGTIEVQRGNMDAAKGYFEDAIQLARTEMEMTHLYSLSVAAEVQSKIAKKLNITPQMPFT